MESSALKRREAEFSRMMEDLDTTREKLKIAEDEVATLRVSIKLYLDNPSIDEVQMVITNMLS